MGSAVTDWFKELLISLLQTLFDNAAQFMELGFTDGLTDLYKTPAEAVGTGVLTAIQKVSQVSIEPVGYVILTYVLCYDLITACINGNNFRDFDTAIFFKFALKGGIATFLMGKATTIAFAFFDLGSEMAAKSKGVLNITVAASSSLYSTSFETLLQEKELGFLIGLVLLALLLYLVMLAMYIVIFVTLLGRAMEVMVYCTLAPIPIATLTNREWGSIGNNYLKSLAALAFQVILIMVVLGIFMGLMTGIMSAASSIDDLPKKTLTCIAYGVVLCFTVLKTGSISKSIFNAH